MELKYENLKLESKLMSMEMVFLGDRRDTQDSKKIEIISKVNIKN